MKFPMKTMLAATALTLSMASLAQAESHTDEPDCPEDMNTTAGCQMEGAVESEAGPVDGAATAPVAPAAVEGEQGSTTLDVDDSAGSGDGSGMAEGEDAARAEDCPEDMDTDPGCDLEGATESEPGPIEGAATAPVAPAAADGEEGSTTLDVTADPGTEGEATDAAATSEEDCPEDMNTDPGCQLEGAAESEAGPVEGAATAPVAPAAAEGEEGSTTLDTDDAPGAEGTDAPADDQDASADPFSMDHPNIAISYDEDGRYYTSDNVPTFNVSADGEVDWLTFSGFRRYHSECHVCHGPDGEGSTYAPALKNSAVEMDYFEFYGVVAGGRQNGNSVMPHFGDNQNVMCYLDDIYVYLKARGLDAIPRGRPGMKQAKSDSIQEAENVCMG